MGSIRIRGAKELHRKFDAAQRREILRKPMQRSVLRLQRDMAEYPPPPANSTYRRTGTLGRRWTTQVRRIANGLRGKVGNNTSYAPWVQSWNFQAWMHQGRWQTDAEVLEENTRNIVDDFQATIRKVLER